MDATGTILSDRQRRITERRARIRAKLAELGAGETEGGGGLAVVPSSDAVPTSGAEKAVYDALTGFRAKTGEFGAQLEALRARADKEALAVLNNDKESALVRRRTLEAEKVACAKIDAAFAMRWSVLVEKDTPEELAAGIIELRRHILDMLESKDRVIAAFEEYLATVDDDYIHLIREQSKEVDDIIAYMRKVLGELKEFSTQRIQDCEKAFDEERAKFIAEREQTLDSIRDDITAVENASLEARTRLAEEYNDNVAAQTLYDYEEYTSLKRRLEAEGVALRHQLEEMRSVYQLNTDKLEYNYRLLAARDVECQNLIIQQKKKISKLQGQLASLIAKHGAIDDRLRTENLELSTSYKRLSNLYCDLQGKFKLFEKADTHKFRELWAHHERTIAANLRDLLLAEQVINESILCIEEKRDVDSRSIEHSVTVMLKKLQHAAGIIDQTDSAADLKDNSILDVTRAIDPVTACAIGPVAAARILNDLASEASFLASDDLLKVMAPNEEITSRMRTDALLSTLGIRNASELDLLFTHITVDGKGIDILPRDQIIDALRAFAAEVVVRREARQQAEGSNANKHQTGIWSNAALKTFWKELEGLIAPEKQTTWRILEDTLAQYREILQARTSIVAHNDQLAAQNEELRSLLQRYISQERQVLGTLGGDTTGGIAVGAPGQSSRQPLSN
ncbi:Sperm tail domain-containing protein [Giardia muris]|uniref:Sperm tail domain-containing protein n=1 Tax=Giardia muris TaxID=5742 RepID=A0A4Z1TDV0_GIAMU|nr:Sperm tail domain-containing protein [Giardia muris]|eukprot:TNJ30729.1 Sperm tail domain-containing protein [Giardia muris]